MEKVSSKKIGLIVFALGVAVLLLSVLNDLYDEALGNYFRAFHNNKVVLHAIVKSIFDEGKQKYWVAFIGWLTTLFFAASFLTNNIKIARTGMCLKVAFSAFYCAYNMPVLFSLYRYAASFFWFQLISCILLLISNVLLLLALIKLGEEGQTYCITACGIYFLSFLFSLKWRELDFLIVGGQILFVLFVLLQIAAITLYLGKREGET